MGRHPFDDEDVQPHGRADQAHLQHQNHDDAEPDRVVTERRDDRQNDRYGQHHHRETFHEGAEHDVDQDDDHQDGESRDGQVADPVGKVHRDAGQRQERRKEMCADQDEENHRGRLDRVEKRVKELGNRQPSRPEGVQEGQARANGCGLGHGEDARIDAPDHDQHHEDKRARSHQRLEPFAHGHTLARRAGVGVHDGDDEDGGDEECREQEARHEASEEKTTDRLLGQKRIDDKDGRGRDQDAECTACRDTARGKAGAVVVALHFRKRDLAHGRRGGNRRA